MSTNQSSFHNHNKTQPTGATKRPLAGPQDLDCVNKKLKRLTDHVLPDSPYLLTVPSDVPFRLGSRFVSNWAVGEDRPFAPDEEHLQYMTFLSHQGEDSLLVAVGGWSDGHGNVMEEEESKPASIASASSTPLSGGPQKKKISLNEYKNKAKESTATNTPVAQKIEKKEGNGSARPKEPPTTAPKPTRRDQDTMEKSRLTKPKDVSLPPKPPPPQPSVNGAPGARKRDESVRQPRSSKPEKHSEPSPHPPKKPRLSPPPRITTKDTSTSPQKNTPTSVPELLSPTLPPTTTTLGLPRLLSPTLPPDIEAELTKPSNTPPHKSGPSNHQRSASGNSSASKSDNATPKTSGGQRQHSGSTSSSNNKPLHPASKTPKLPSTTSKSGAVNSKDIASPKSNKLPKPAEKPSNPAAKSRPPSNPASPSEPPLSRIVKLRYGRANRKRVEALLKFSGKRKVDISTKQGRAPELEANKKRDPGRESSTSKAVESDQARSAGARGEKRPRAIDDHEKSDHAMKRPRSTANLIVPEKARSPAQTSAPKSPSRPRQPSTSKSQISTPKKDIKSVAMRRVESADSDVKTPTGMGTGTPGNMEKSAKPSPSTSFDNQASKSRDADWRAWREEFQKYAGVGRDLKHAASRQSQNNPSKAAEKLGAAIAVEAIICFILAFIAENQQKALMRQNGDSSTWRSILPYWNVVKHMTAPYPHLHGLCLLLGAVSHDTIHGIDLERLSNSALPCDHNPIPTPGSDGNTVLSDEGKKYKKDFLDLKARLSDHYKEAQKFWLEGSRGLPDDILAREYPNTWSKRSRNYSMRGKQKLRIGEYNCEMFLPLGRTTTPIEAVRFGWSFLGEWCEKEGVDWTGRLGL
ncbi:hypothetical protein FQN54_005810 [Arachnomyces sp. PD_36]|nr:hypothetical protein FQN54_005810 [Arachnomyces sp. PD_36]